MAPGESLVVREVLHLGEEQPAGKDVVVADLEPAGDLDRARRGVERMDVRGRVPIDETQTLGVDLPP